MRIGGTVGTRGRLTQGIQAAKSGDKLTARNVFYDIVDRDPRNETVWMWLSYVVDSIEDRQICLENVLTLNPRNDYARHSLAQLYQAIPQSRQLTKATAVVVRAKDNFATTSITLMMVIAFWAGLATLSFVVGVMDIVNWGFDVIFSRSFPHYITPYQLWTLTIPVVFLILSIILFNIVWALFFKYEIGYFASILLSLGFTVVTPVLILLSETPNLGYAIFSVAMSASILFLTLMSQTGFNHGQKLAPYFEGR